METHLDGSWRAVRASGIPQRLMTRFFPSVGALAAFHYVYIIVVNCRGLGPPRWEPACPWIQLPSLPLRQRHTLWWLLLFLVIDVASSSASVMY